MMEDFGQFGRVPPGLAEIGEAARQFSPLIPGADALEDCAAGTLAGMTMLALPGTTERRYAMALALRALAPGAAATILAPKEKGGSRLGDELRGFGCLVEETFRRHHRICRFDRPAEFLGMEAALAAGGPQRIDALGLWSQPGIFSWNRPDPGSVLLAQHLPPMAGDGADFGCGTGFLAHACLASPKLTSLALIDLDRRAVEAARRNVADGRASFVWADVRALPAAPTGLDFVVMNPPFHEAGHEDQGLGQDFIRQASARLRKSGRLWMTANRHLPYESVLKTQFRHVAVVAEAAGFKIFEAQK